MNDGDSISDCPCSLCVSFLRKSRQRVSTARSLSMEAEKSRKLSMMNSSLGEKLIEEETAEEGSVSDYLLYDRYCVKFVQPIRCIVLLRVLPIGEN